MVSIRILILKKRFLIYGGDIKKIPYTIRILLESLLRKYDGLDVKKITLKICDYENYLKFIFQEINKKTKLPIVEWLT